MFNLWVTLALMAKAIRSHRRELRRCFLGQTIRFSRVALVGVEGKSCLSQRFLIYPGNFSPTSVSFPLN